MPSCAASPQLACILLQLAFVLHSSDQRTVPQAAKDGSGPRPAAQSAKRCFLNCVETSLRPSICPRSCTASFQLAFVPLPLAFVLHGSGQRTASHGQNTMGVKDGSGPQPAAQSAKRCFLNCLETSLRPSMCLPSCTASFQLACVLLTLAFVLRGSGQRTVLQGQNTMAVKDGLGPQPAAQSTKRCFLNCVETSLRPSICPRSCAASFQLACVPLPLAFVLRGSG